MTAFDSIGAAAVVGLLFAANVCVLGFGAFIWGRAFAEVQRGRAHQISVDAQAETVKASRDALQEIERGKEVGSLGVHEYVEEPSEDELIAAIRAQREIEARESGNADPPSEEPIGTYREYTTDDNDIRTQHADQGPIVPGTEMYQYENEQPEGVL